MLRGTSPGRQLAVKVTGDDTTPALAVIPALITAKARAAVMIPVRSF